MPISTGWIINRPNINPGDTVEINFHHCGQLIGVVTRIEENNSYDAQGEYRYWVYAEYQLPCGKTTELGVDSSQILSVRHSQVSRDAAGGE